MVIPSTLLCFVNLKMQTSIFIVFIYFKTTLNKNYVSNYLFIYLIKCLLVSVIFI